MNLIFALALGVAAPANATRASANPATAMVAMSASAVDSLYNEIGLSGTVERDAFVAGIRSMEQHNLHGGKLAIADMTQPSTAKRLTIVDLDTRRVVLNTYVAHGQGSGELMATHFSNTMDSHQTSLGLFRVGQAINRPKNGPAVLLAGLDKGVNDRAQARELIIHSAPYVSDAFIAAHGKLGRSWGCPAVSPTVLGKVIVTLADGGLLYIYGG